MPASYRAQHIGSLLRPPFLLQARAAHAAGSLPLEQLRAAEDRAILEVLEKQRQIGLDVVTDGEMRRGSWLTDMAEAVEGFVSERVPLEWKGPGGGVEGSSALAAGAKLRKLRKMTGHEVPFLKKHTNGPFKVTLPALRISCWRAIRRASPTNSIQRTPTCSKISWKLSATM